MKTRQAFYLHTTKLTRIARRLCREILRPWHAARHPYMPINSAAIKAECEWRPPPPSRALCPVPCALSPQEGRAGALGVPHWELWPRAPLTYAGPPHTGTARLPEASQSPLVLKQAVRKPLEAVLRYLGKPAPAPHGQRGQPAAACGGGGMPSHSPPTAAQAPELPVCCCSL